MATHTTFARFAHFSWKFGEASHMKCHFRACCKFGKHWISVWQVIWVWQITKNPIKGFWWVLTLTKFSKSVKFVKFTKFVTICKQWKIHYFVLWLVVIEGWEMWKCKQSDYVITVTSFRNYSMGFNSHLFCNSKVKFSLKNE